MLTKIKEMKKNFKNSFAYALLFTPIIGNDSYANGVKEIDVDTIMPKFFGQVTQIFFWIGALLLLWGLGQLFLSFRNEDSDSKSRSIMVIMSAIMLMGTKAIFMAITGLTVSNVGKQ